VTSKRKKKPASTVDNDERWLEEELERYYKETRSAITLNPELRSLFEKVRSRVRVATCDELKEMLEKARMLRDNIEWEDKPEFDLVNHIFSRLLSTLKKRCREMWIEYTDKLAPRYVHRMEEALHWGRVKPRKARE